MGDDLNNRGPKDRSKINVDQHWEIEYWTEKLDVSEELLQEAVEKAGVMVSDVKEWLERN